MSCNALTSPWTDVYVAMKDVTECLTICGVIHAKHPLHNNSVGRNLSLEVCCLAVPDVCQNVHVLAVRCATGIGIAAWK